MTFAPRLRRDLARQASHISVAKGAVSYFVIAIMPVIHSKFALLTGHRLFDQSQELGVACPRFESVLNSAPVLSEMSAVLRDVRC